MEKNAAGKVQRARRLTGAMSAEDREQIETDHEVARANYQQAVLDAEATLASARYRQASLESMQRRLQETRILAPFPRGVESYGDPVEYAVCQRSVAEGEVVWAMPNIPGASTTLFKLVIDRPLKFQATVPERHRGDIKIGQSAELEVEAYPSEPFAGRVSRINPAVDRTSRTFQVEVLIPNADRRLSPGSFARAEVLTRVDPAARTVPEEAIVTFAGVTKVFVVRDGKVHEVHVRPGASLTVAGRTWVEVEGPLPPDASVVTSGQSQLADGAAVRMRTQPSGREER